LATRAAQRRAGRSEPGPDARVSQLVARHERSLMRVARHWSLCRDDALDAYQRALEIYVRRLESLDPATEISWLRVVVKHEALAVRRQRAESLPFDEVDLDTRAPESQRPVDDLLAGRERVKRSAEALRRIKPDEAKALMLKAQGLSYAEIGESLSWSYTKVNRSITEGRARFLKVYAEIEAGEECERFAPTLAALVGGTASADALLELRPHIRNCAACRATVRELHATRLGRLGALSPLPLLVAPLRWVLGRFGERAGEHGADAGPARDGVLKLSTRDGVPELSAGGGVPELSPPGSASDVYDAVAALDLPSASQGRPLAVEWALHRAGDGIANLKQQAAAGYARALDPTPLAGTRPGAVVAAVAGCLAIGGGTTYCVSQGVDPIGGLAHVVSPSHVEKQAQPRKKRRAPRRTSATPAPSPSPTPFARPTPEPRESTPQPTTAPTVQATPQPTPEPTPRPIPAEEYEPLGQAASAGTAPGSSAKPAPAPAGGAGEFDGP
jgi:RNA polymerase sigma factor (sigma-70 family)